MKFEDEKPKSTKPYHHKKTSKKRKSELYDSDEKKKKSNDDTDTAVYYFTLPSRSDYPLNRDGYLYSLAEPDPLAMDHTFRYEDYIVKPIPSKYYRGYSYNNIAFSYSDKAQQLKLIDDYTVSGQKGYCMVRATHGVLMGCYYFEATVLDNPDESALRIGWSQKYASLQAPCGYDKLSYSWRSLYGTRFHESKGKSYGEGYSKGDVLGCLITLPMNNSLMSPSLKNYTLVKFKSNFYFEETYLPVNIFKMLHVLEESEIRFYKNGIDQGTAFSNINSGKYYPTISIYKNAKVCINFGPQFLFPPINKTYKPVIYTTISSKLFRCRIELRKKN